MSQIDLDRFKEACDYPGRLDISAVESALGAYLGAIGIKRNIVRIMPGWELTDYPAIERAVLWILDNCKRRGDDLSSARDAVAAHNAQAAREALDARHAKDALDARLSVGACDARTVRAERDARESLDSTVGEVQRYYSSLVRTPDGWHPAPIPRDIRSATPDSAELIASTKCLSMAAPEALSELFSRDAGVARAAASASAAHLARSVRAANDARSALSAIDGHYAPSAHDTGNPSQLKRFAAWCIQRGWWYWDWDLSWFACTHFGAKELNKPEVLRWSEPLLEAFCAGAWLLYWTDTDLFWVAKPTLHRETNPRRLHNDHYAALESDVENLYFWHGVLVPAFVVVRPEWITLKHIETETNAEVRRVMIERYGQAKYLMDAGGQEIHRDDFGVLYRKQIPGDEPLVMVKVINSTPEPDGSFKDYFLRVPADIQRARQAVAWTFGKSEEQYDPEKQS